ncbi:MAG: MFS transporter [Acidobacteria bacterium]|nr:MAG: MFS transporter [Acidobacteriota bacterium]
MINVKELSKRYARTTAVDHISFDVAKGQIVGFLGPNGAGKTTTMRILTCFMPPSSGTATVAGFDVLEQPMEVKKRIGYLPETPPLYPEMETAEYLKFVGQLKGLSGAELQKRVDYVCERCSVADVRNKLLGKLSKGYRETRDLIRSLAGSHTIILSTHILPEVEQTCEQVVIINKGKLVATDSVRNLQARARGAESIMLEVASRNGSLEISMVQQKLERVAGVSRVLCKHQVDSRAFFEVETQKGRLLRGDLARAVVESGWDLNELRPAAMSLEEVFLQLTEKDAPAESAAAKGAQP